MGASTAIIESGEIRCLPAKRPKWLVLVRVDVVGGGDGKGMSLFVHIENTEPFKEGKKISTC